MIIFENEVVRISIDKETPCVEWVANGKMTTEQYKESVIKTLDAYLSVKAEFANLGWYIDGRKFEALDVNTIEWVATEITPKFIEAGLKHQVFVIPEDALGLLVVEDYLDKTKGKLTQMFFSSEKEAKVWLMKEMSLTSKTTGNVVY